MREAHGGEKKEKARELSDGTERIGEKQAELTEGMTDNKEGERREGTGGGKIEKRGGGYKTKAEGGYRTDEVKKTEIEEGA